VVTRSPPFQPAAVPDSRPVTEVDAARVRAAVAGVRKVQTALENAVAQELRDVADRLVRTGLRLP
jgi:hypothetical protein